MGSNLNILNLPALHLKKPENNQETFGWDLDTWPWVEWRNGIFHAYLRKLILVICVWKAVNENTILRISSLDLSAVKQCENGLGLEIIRFRYIIIEGRKILS